MAEYSDRRFHYRKSCPVKCDCHNIPGCRMCNECYTHHNLSMRQWKNHMEEFNKREMEKISKGAV